MKRFRVVLMVAVSMLITGITFAAVDRKEAATGPLTQKNILQRYGFIDENADGINDLARDADNDGIPNCIDPDWVRPQDGTGYMNRFGYKNQHAHQNTGLLNGSCNNYNYNYSHQWQNNGSGNNDSGNSDPTNPDPQPNRNRRTNRKH